MSLGRLIFVLVLLSSLFGCFNSGTKRIPRDRYEGNRIFDFEGLLHPKDSSYFNQLFIAHERKTSNQIALVCTADIGPFESLEHYAVHFFDSLGVGQQDLGNGLGIAVSRNLRACYVATGYGTSIVLPDSTVGRIVDTAMLPRFKEEDFVSGIRDGAQAFIRHPEKPENRMDL